MKPPPRSRSAWVLGLVLVFAAVVPRSAAGADPLAARVIILANASQPESVELARYYAQRREIPAATEAEIGRAHV